MLVSWPFLSFLSFFFSLAYREIKSRDPFREIFTAGKMAREKVEKVGKLKPATTEAWLFSDVENRVGNVTDGTAVV